MKLADFDRYQNGACFASGYAHTYGVESAKRAVDVFERRGTDKAYLAGMTDALLDHVQTREELAPGCYRIRPVRGAE